MSASEKHQKQLEFYQSEIRRCEQSIVTQKLGYEKSIRDLQAQLEVKDKPVDE